MTEQYKGQTIYDRGVVRGPINIEIRGEIILAREELTWKNRLLAKLAYYTVYSYPMAFLYLKTAQRLFGKDLEKAIIENK